MTPEPMTGYYPHDHMRYGDFLNKKEDNTFRNRITATKQMKQEDDWNQMQINIWYNMINVSIYLNLFKKII